MKTKFMGLCMAAAFAFSTAAPLTNIAYAAEATKIYVAANGNDDEDGSIDFPVRSLNGAKNLVQKIKEDNGGMPAGGIEIIFRGGTYPIGTNGVELGSAFSGDEGKELKLTAYPGEDVTFTGASKILPEDIKKVTDNATLSRLPEESRGKVYSVSMETLGVSEAEMGECIKYIYGKGVTPTIDFYFNDQTMEISRWPNSDADDKGYIKYGDVIEDKTADPESAYFSFEFDNERTKRWETADQMHVVGYFGNGYTAPGLEASCKDGVITASTKNNDTGTWAGYKDGKKFYAYNLLEEIDKPGEYFLDRNKGIMYFYPVSAVELADVSYSVSLKPMLTINDANYVTINGIIFDKCANSALMIDSGSHITIKNCTVKNIGGRGIDSGYNRELTYIDILDNHFYNIGNECIVLLNSKNTRERQKNAESCHSRINNNHFHNWSLYGKTYVAATSIWDVGYEVKNNVFNNSTHMLGNFGGAPELNFENNEMYDLVEECDDAGMFYCGRTYLTRGIKVNNNYFHHLSSKTGGVSCVYLDDKFSGVTVTNNIFYKVDRGIGFSGGRDNIANNNILIDKNPKSMLFISQEARLKGFEWNIEAIQQSLEKNSDLWKNNPVWKEKYPEFYDAFNDDYSYNDKTFYPKGEITNNLSVRGKGYQIATEAEQNGVVLKNNYETNDLLKFADYENRDFTLTEDALSDFPGVKPIDFYSIGIQPSENDSRTYIERLIANCVVLNINNPKGIVDNEIKAIDANDASVMPLVKDDRTLVPIRFIAESFGAKVDWDEATSTVIINVDGGEIKMPLGASEYTVNGNAYTLDVPAQTISDRTMVPVRVIAETLGKTVYWDENKELVIIGGSDLKSLNTEYDKYRMNHIKNMMK